MNEELDGKLRRLSIDSTPERLALLEQNVLEAVAGHRFSSSETLFRAGSVAGCVALVMGVLGGVLPATPDQTFDPLTPLLETSHLAPSSLLVERQ